MNLSSILTSVFSSIIANPKEAETTILGWINMFKATTAPSPVTVPAAPATGNVPAVSEVTKKPSPAIKELQHMLNQAVKPQPPLAEDGWLGPRTEKAIHDAVAMAKPYLSMLG